MEFVGWDICTHYMMRFVKRGYSTHHKVDTFVLEFQWLGAKNGVTKSLAQRLRIRANKKT